MKGKGRGPVNAERGEPRAAAKQASRAAAGDGGREQRDEFLALLSHELRNPLAAIHHASELLNIPNLSADKQRKAREVISRQTQQMGRLIDDLVDLAQLRHGSMRLHCEATAISTILEEVIDVTAPAAAAAGVTVDVQAPDRELWVDGDPTRLQQLFVNLVGNAIKYTPSGRSVHIISESDARTIVVRVCDEGVGMEAHLLTSIFTLFRRGHGALRGDTHSLGVGLALARGIARAHGGDLVAHSEGPGRGSELTTTLPALVRSPG